MICPHCGNEVNMGYIYNAVNPAGGLNVNDVFLAPLNLNEAQTITIKVDANSLNTAAGCNPYPIITTIKF